VHALEWEVYEEAVSCFGKVVKDYTKKNYDEFIHLPIEFPFIMDGHRPVSEIFRNKSEKLLLNTYYELNIKPLIVRGSMENRLEQIVKYLGLETVMSANAAINEAALLRTYKFDRIMLETSTSDKAKSGITD
jgi:hypothetical protein